MSHDQMDAGRPGGGARPGPGSDPALEAIIEQFVSAVPDPAGTGRDRRLQDVFARGDRLDPDPDLVPRATGSPPAKGRRWLPGGIGWLLLVAACLLVAVGLWRLSGGHEPQPKDDHVEPGKSDYPTPPRPWYRQTENEFPDQIILSYTSREYRLLQGEQGVRPSSDPSLRARIGRRKARFDGLRWDPASKAVLLRFVSPGDCPPPERLIGVVFLGKDGGPLWPPGRDQAFVLLCPASPDGTRWVAELAVPEEDLRAVHRSCSEYRFAVVPPSALTAADVGALVDMVTRAPDKAAVRDWLKVVPFPEASLRDRLSEAAGLGR